MASPDIRAITIVNGSASLLNDSAKQIYTFAIQLPYLNMALQDLKKLLQLSNAPVTNDDSAAITVPANTEEIVFNAIPPAPSLPDDLIDIRQLWESDDGLNWVPMRKLEFIPHYLEGINTNQWLFWTWQDNRIKLLPANAINYLKIDYIKNLFMNIAHENDIIGVINSDSYLQYRTAALCSEFIGENPTRALALNYQADNAWAIMQGIDSKSKQAIYTRRRPFRAAWKQRGFLG